MTASDRNFSIRRMDEAMLWAILPLSLLSRISPSEAQMPLWARLFTQQLIGSFSTYGYFYRVRWRLPQNNWVTRIVASIRRPL